jgi:hypothetical protein
VRDLLSIAHGSDLPEDQCCAYLTQVGLCSKDYLNRQVDSSLSGGEIKRIEIATLMARDLQMAIYAAVEGRDLATYLAVVTKQDPPDKEIISVPRWRRVELLEDVKKSMPRILDVKAGRIQPRRCGVCEYCRSTKMLTEPIDFELVGFSAAERRVILGG